MKTSLTEARRLLQKAEDVLVITGAGISAESGVPTFRGAGEKWRNRHFTELANPKAFEADPKFIWDWYLYRRSIVAACEPNAAHRALAAWQMRGAHRSIVTQNVDGLHERVGSEVVRMHGSLWRNTCLACFEDREDYSLSFEAADGLPRSPCHHSLERPAIVWFGEMIPKEASVSAQHLAAMADVIITIGTSGLVDTANRLIKTARDLRELQPAPSPRSLIVIDINLEETEVQATHRLLGPAGSIVPELLSP